MTSYTWLREVTEPAVPLVTYGANPVKISGSVAELHFTSGLHFKWSREPTLDEEVLPWVKKSFMELQTSTRWGM